MTARIIGTWHGEQALRLAGDGLAVVILPDRGGKIASLVDATGREWLAQPAGGRLPTSGYGASFVGSEMCGWDEMVPTIATAGLPDHGEVWGVPWTRVEVSDRSVVLEVAGRALPYLLRRSVELIDGNRLLLSYEATAVDRTVELLWAAHPQFRAPAGTTVELPEQVRTVLDVTDADSPRMVPWSGGRVDVMRGLADAEGRKVWCRPEDIPAWCRLHRDGGGRLELSWDPGQVPYLGVWIDNRSRSREQVVALEPSTGFYDDLDRARRSGRVTRLVPDTWTRWQLTVSVRDVPEETDS